MVSFIEGKGDERIVILFIDRFVYDFNIECFIWFFVSGLVRQGGLACCIAGCFSCMPSAICIEELASTQVGCPFVVEPQLLSCVVGALLGDGFMRGSGRFWRRCLEGIAVGMVSAGGAVCCRDVARRTR